MAGGPLLAVAPVEPAEAESPGAPCSATADRARPPAPTQPADAGFLQKDTHAWKLFTGLAEPFGVVGAHCRLRVSLPTAPSFPLSSHRYQTQITSPRLFLPPSHSPLQAFTPANLLHISVHLDTCFSETPNGHKQKREQRQAYSVLLEALTWKLKNHRACAPQIYTDTPVPFGSGTEGGTEVRELMRCSPAVPFPCFTSFHSRAWKSQCQ